MSLQRKIMTLIAPIPDPTTRMDVASTINYLFSVYNTGVVNDDEVKDALFEVCRDVLEATNPDLGMEEIRKRAETLAKEFMSAFKLESSVRRMMSRFRGRFMPL
ncbi:MAG: hypothetical protein DRP01_01645 [Archaeoglobales archaeon]|nr:MAG: hypothetical protein DRP01_01645 [Archaeoglobales archaeon]